MMFLAARAARNIWQKPSKISHFFPPFPDKILFIIYTDLQGNPLHILLLLPIDPF